jgi:WD40 repeat protein
MKVWDVSTSTKDRQAGGQELLSLKGAAGGGCFSPDGTRLAAASGSPDNQVKVWDARTGQQLLNIKAHTGPITSVCFSPDGTRLASGSSDKTARVWDAGSGQQLLALVGHLDSVTGVCFSPDGQRLATASHDQIAMVWDAHTGRPLLGFKGHTGFLNSVCFSPDGQRLVTGSVDHTAKVWDVATSTEGRQWGGQQHLDLKGHTATVWSVCFSPDSRRLASAGGDVTNPGKAGEVKVWDAPTGQELLTIKGHTGFVRGVCFSPDGRRLATASSDNTAKVWDARTGQQLLTLRGHTDQVLGVCFSPDGQRLATGSWDRTAKVWDARTGQLLLTLKGLTSSVWSVCFSPPGDDPGAMGRRLVTAGGDQSKPGEVKVWDARTGELLLDLKGHTETVWRVCFSADAQRLATGSVDRTAKVWDARTGQQLLTLRAHVDTVHGVCFSPDGERLVTGGWDTAAKVWDVRTGQQLLALRGHTRAVYSVCFSPDGGRLATAGWDIYNPGRPGEVKVWDGRTGQEVFALRGHTDGVTTACFSPDGRRLAAGGYDKTVKVWDVQTGKEVFGLRGHAQAIQSICFSPDGNRLVAVSGREFGAKMQPAPSEGKVWDLSMSAEGRQAGGREAFSLRGHTGWLTGVCFSQDSQRLVGTEPSGKAVVWDARTGRLLDEPPPPTVPGGAHSPDSRLFAWNDGNAVRLLRPPDDEELLVRRARTRLDPDWHAEQAARLELGQQWPAAAFHLEQALTARPSAAGRDRLVRALTETTRAQPELSSGWRRLALAQLQAGQEDAFRHTCRRMQQRFRVPGPLPQAVFALGSMPSHPAGAAVTAALPGHPAAPAGAGLFDRLQTVGASVLRPGTLPDPESWLPEIPADEKLLRGAILCRAGKHADAVKELQPLTEPIACLFRALSEHGRGSMGPARQALDEALKGLPPEKIDLYRQTPLPWQQRVESDTLRREAEALLAK